MNSVVPFIRQLFIDDTNPTFLTGGALLTVLCWTIGIIYWGIDIYLLPLMIAIILFAMTAPLILILYMTRKRKEGQRVKNLGKLKSLAFGIYLGLILLNPITDWDNKQRQRSGLIVSESLEKYKSNHGNYPVSLTEIKSELTALPSTYPWERYSYHLTDTAYDLDLPGPFIDIWHWDQKEKTFVYTD